LKFANYLNDKNINFSVYNDLYQLLSFGDFFKVFRLSSGIHSVFSDSMFFFRFNRCVFFEGELDLIFEGRYLIAQKPCIADTQGQDGGL